MHTVSLNGTTVIPSKVVCIGRNYVEHIQELGNKMPDQMVVFNKPNSAISNTLFSEADEPLHYETELCFLLKNGQFAAVGVGLDLTKRQLQGKLKKDGHPWERAKAFNHSALFSPFIDLPPSLGDLTFSLCIDGKLTQQGNIELMIHKPDTMLADIQSFMTLEDNDIVMTGTPKGVGLVALGAEFTVELYQAENPLIKHSWIAQ